jgi:hypothetical protein
MKISQISVFLENKSGRLAHITRVLREADVNILALSLADTSDFGILRLIVSDTKKAKDALAAESIVCMVNEVTGVEVENKPGGLAAILDALEGAEVNVEYMYAYAENKSEKAALIFRFDDPDTAVEKLEKAGINILS